MDYFNDVYLKRINRFGDNIQSRVHGQMEYDFEDKLRKSVNRVDLFDYYNKDKQIGEGILETNKIEEKKTLNYLCTRISDNYENGFMFYTQKPFSKEKQTWLILFKEQYETIGYNRYKVVLLENELNWIGKDGLIHSTYVHYIGSMDSAIKEEFKINFDVAAGIPSKSLSMICAYNEDLKRDLRINIQDETWRVCGYDKISVPGVMYVTLEEDFVQKAEYANEEELEKWSIISEQGYEITTTGKQFIQFYCSYNGSLTNEKLMIACDNENVKIICDKDNRFCFEGAPTTAKIVVCLQNAQKVKQEFNLTIAAEQQDWLAIVGPKQIKVLQTLEYELNSSIKDYNVSIVSEFGYFKIDRIEDNKVYIQGINIGQDNIIVRYNGAEYKTPINVISPWM